MSVGVGGVKSYASGFCVPWFVGRLNHKLPRVHDRLTRPFSSNDEDSSSSSSLVLLCFMMSFGLVCDKRWCRLMKHATM